MMMEKQFFVVDIEKGWAANGVGRKLWPIARNSDS
jgi:hypothetical protein